MNTKRTPPEIRFWRHVRITECCWYWTGGTIKSGARTYGAFGYGSGAADKRQTTAHRYSLMMQLGRDLLPGMDACHNCPCGDKELCVRPAHLWEGTKKQNIHDTIAKGRRAPFELTRRPGSKNGQSKLTEADIPVIRARSRAGESDTVIAHDFSVSPAVVWFIKTGRRWNHVVDETT